jgi:hypothetical protein
VEADNLQLPFNKMKNMDDIDWPIPFTNCENPYTSHRMSLCAQLRYSQNQTLCDLTYTERWEKNTEFWKNISIDETGVSAVQTGKTVLAKEEQKKSVEWLMQRVGKCKC